jgi:hypothetical protein
LRFWLKKLGLVIEIENFREIGISMVTSNLSQGMLDMGRVQKDACNNPALLRHSQHPSV